jgi:hypothetical protein
LKFKTKFALGFAIVGFGIGMALCGYAFYLTSHGRIDNEALFLILCPLSIGAVALDNAGVLGGIISWVFISVENAGLYALVGLALSGLVGNAPN